MTRASEAQTISRERAVALKDISRNITGNLKKGELDCGIT